MLAKAAVAAAFLPALALACHSHVERRAVNAARGAVDRTTEQGESLILDPNQECAAYGYEPVNDLVRLSPSHTEAQPCSLPPRQARWVKLERTTR